MSHFLEKIISVSGFHETLLRLLLVACAGIFPKTQLSLMIHQDCLQLRQTVLCRLMMQSEKMLIQFS